MLGTLQQQHAVTISIEDAHDAGDDASMAWGIDSLWHVHYFWHPAGSHAATISINNMDKCDHIACGD